MPPLRKHNSSPTDSVRFQTAHIASESAMSSILEQHNQAKRNKPPVGSDMSIMEVDLEAAVGALTPPLRIYRPDPATGELRLAETIGAAAFRERALNTAEGQHHQRLRAELQNKRIRAGRRAKVRALTSNRTGRVERRPMLDEEDEE